MTADIPDRAEIVRDLMYAAVCLGQDLTGEAKRQLSELVAKFADPRVHPQATAIGDRLARARQMLVPVEKDRIGIGNLIWDAFKIYSEDEDAK